MYMYIVFEMDEKCNESSVVLQFSNFLVLQMLTSE